MVLPMYEKSILIICIWRQKMLLKKPHILQKKYILLTHFLEEHIFGIQLIHVDLKIATMLYS